MKPTGTVRALTAVATTVATFVLIWVGAGLGDMYQYQVIAVGALLLGAVVGPQSHPVPPGARIIVSLLLAASVFSVVNTLYEGHGVLAALPFAVACITGIALSQRMARSRREAESAADALEDTAENEARDPDERGAGVGPWRAGSSV